jgi:ABC-type proline/glycine betaine transport system substrate-binding protein
MKLRVMCLQETGEELLISYADNMNQAEAAVAEHMENHPEHYGAWVEDAEVGYALTFVSQ